ncbi:putative transcription factor C2C2-GATA family [Medicago truncatula]|uniref:GATA type zinc finger transcription factor family protein n=1 Tax=Medicago truncatula TaxID=3880 RepID=A0A072TY39_MEDTR|nr:GATA type zinc finger transcription factor family protein [Medicago truncatula]RHN45563.1 putative transcription factor C2C2-GATA family [Medicago truncatula]
MAIFDFNSKSKYHEENHAEQFHYYIPKEVLQNLETYPTFWDTMENSLQEDSNYFLFCDTYEKEKVKFNQLGEGNTQSFDVTNVQINQEENIDTYLSNDFVWPNIYEREIINLEQQNLKVPFLDVSNIHAINQENLPKEKLDTIIHKENMKEEQYGKGNTQKPLQRTKVKSNSIKKNRDKIIDIYKERSCSHCETKYTTQWRLGPLGKNTLCNACGLRYKSNRLVKGYRPVASPSFDFNKHSNFHKILLRKEG